MFPGAAIYSAPSLLLIIDNGCALFGRASIAICFIRIPPPRWRVREPALLPPRRRGVRTYAAECASTGYRGISHGRLAGPDILSGRNRHASASRGRCAGRRSAYRPRKHRRLADSRDLRTSSGRWYLVGREYHWAYGSVILTLPIFCSARLRFFICYLIQRLTIYR